MTNPGRVKEAFADALDVPPEDRLAFVEEKLADDPEGRQKVLELLSAHALGERFLSSPTTPGAAALGAQIAQEAPGTRIGPYRILQHIGEGGFGSVYMAEQQEPVRRRVALKVIKLGMDTRQVVARFEAERQALALMDHTNIARVLDAGATQSGRPYFVMELVKGDPITAYCDKNNLTIPERLELFAQVCHAVQHAHQKGVVHRDIKPSNVLVSTLDGRPQAKVIDFGIAKATDHRLTEKTLFTEHRALIGTPEYMSPEQAEGSLDIDTRTDIYALGVLLYELLTGTTPFDPRKLRSALFGELQRIIREEEPEKPSTRLSHAADTPGDVADRRSSDLAHLRKSIRGDLDWIVMKCLDKDRARRYETANGLAIDVQRHLQGEPVAAAPPGAMYRVRKLVRRHKGAVFAGSLLLGAILLGLIGTTWGMVSAERARDLANQRFEQAEKARAEAQAARERADKMNRVANAVTDFFTQDVLNARPVPAGQHEPTLREMLDAVPQKIDQYFKSEPAIEGVIRERVGQLYRRLGDTKQSEAYLVEAIPLLQEGLGGDSKSTLAAIQRLGEWYTDMQRYDEAAARFRQAYEGRLKAYGMEYALTVNSLSRMGNALVYAGKHEEGLRAMRQAWDYNREHFGQNSRQALLAARDMAESLTHIGRAAEARDILHELIEMMAANPDELARFDGMIRELLGNALFKLGQYEESLQELDKALAWAQTRYPEGHAALFDMRWRRGTVFVELGRTSQARTEFEAAYAIAEATYGAQDHRAREVAQHLVDVAESEGNSAEAQRWRDRLQPK